jgi:hypothetical protein
LLAMRRALRTKPRRPTAKREMWVEADNH